MKNIENKVFENRILTKDEIIEKIESMKSIDVI